MQFIDKITLNRTYALVRKVIFILFEKLAISYCVWKHWANFKQYMTECDKAQLRGKYYIGTGLTGGSWGEGLQATGMAVSEGGNACRDKHWCIR